MAEADRTTPQTVRKKLRKKKPKPAPKKAYKLPSNFRTEAPARKEKPKAGPVAPQKTGGRSSRPQPIARKRTAPPSRTDRTSDAKRTPVQKKHDRQVVDATVREMRREVLRKRGRGAAGKQLKKELEGRGALADVSDKLGKLIEKNAVLQGTGGGPGAARVSIKAGGGKVSGGGATALSPKPMKIAGTGVGRTIKDLVNLPAQALPSLYVPTAGVVEAAKGDPSRLKKFAKDIDENDPVYNAAAAGVEAAGGDMKSAKERLKRAGESAREHPGFAAVEVLGVKGVIGRGGGTAARSGVGGKRAKRAASTEREARQVPGTDLREERTYSRDVITKAGQVAAERTKRKRARRLRRKADEAPEGSDKQIELRQKAAQADPDRLPEKEIRRRVDERVAVNEDVRRAHRAQATSEARKIVKSTKREGHAVPVVAQRIVRADKKDLQAYIRELEQHTAELSPAGRRANVRLRRELQKVVDDPKADLGKVETAAVEYRKLIDPLEKKLVKRGLLGEGQEAKAKLIPYAVRHMDAKHDPEKGLVTKHGAQLTDGAIRGHMKRHGVQEPAFITQAPNQRGARNFNVRSEKPQQLYDTRRSGEATRKGTFDADPETLVEGTARAQGLVDATDGFRKTIKEFSIRGEGGKVTRYKSYKQADQARRDVAAKDPEHVALRPVRLNPFGGKREQLDKLLEDVDSLDQPQAQAIVDSMREGLTSTEGDGPWALVPEAAANRLLEHLNAQGGGGGVKTLQLANQAFRKTVLATSPSWMAGNLIEGMFRSGLAKAGPVSYARGRKALKQLGEIDPKAADEAMSRIVGGGHFSSADRAHVRRGAEQFSGTALAPLATALGRLWRTPGPKQMAEFWNRYTDWVFNSVNGRTESAMQTAMLGRALKEAGYKATQDAAKGLKGTAAQVRFGREVDRMYGRYGKRSPAERRVFATYTPFAPWAINAAYFVYRTLPRDHPVATAVTAAAVNATEEWRKEEGLDLFIEGALPGFLQGSIPTSSGGRQRISRFTPFGAFGSPSETLAGQVLPLWTGALAALKGKDWKGRDLKVGPEGKQRDANEIDRFVFAARAFAEATVPVVGVAQRVAEQGPKALNPFKDVKPQDKAKKKLKIATPAAKKKLRSTSGSGGGSFFGGSSSSGGSSSGGGFFGP